MTRIIAALLAAIVLCACAKSEPDAFLKEKYSKEGIRARSDEISAHPPSLSIDEIDAIKERMRERELERFPFSEAE